MPSDLPQTAPVIVDPGRRSWVPGADGGDFPLQNLPYGVVSRGGGPPRPAVAIGDQVVDLAAAARAGLLAGHVDAAEALFAEARLDALMAAGPAVWAALRARLVDLLADDGDDALRAGPGDVLLDAAVTTHLPFTVGDYVDFYSSLEHATNLGRMFRPEGEPLLPNWRHLPVGYHGRAGTVVASGTPVYRPRGQRKAPDDDAPTVGPSRSLDIEAEVGFVVGRGSRLGEPVSTGAIREHVFGLVLVNDWSARDIQAWEYQPLGPFLGKSFATSVSPWIVPLDALEPYRVAPPPQEPPVADYLRCDEDWALAMTLEVTLSTASLRAAGQRAALLSRPPFAGMYWTMPQQVAHATVNGASLRTGDLFASGTVSGPEPDTLGSLIELTWRGTRPLALPDGTTRTFLEDGDEVTLTATCSAPGRPTIGFGAVTGMIEPAVAGVRPS